LPAASSRTCSTSLLDVRRLRLFDRRRQPAGALRNRALFVRRHYRRAYTADFPALVNDMML